ncbi:hypothetical protein KBF38_01675 [bacterium]|nr:hypothetical protein [bacterium]
MHRKPPLSMFAKLATAATCLLALFFTGAHRGNAEAGERVLPFSPSYSVGNLMALKGVPEIFGNCKGSLVAEARGLVKLPAGKQIKFAPNGTFYQHPECLLKLPRDAFDFVELSFLSMADEEDAFCDRAIPYLGHISSLKGIDLDNSDASDKGLSQLPAMPQLQMLTACESKVSGTCLPKLLACKKLEAFRLSNVVVNNESLRWLKDFPQLQRLGLVRVDLSMVGIEHLSKCRDLQLLDIDYNYRLDDKVVPFLLKLTKLKTLWLGETSISVQGLEQLGKLHLVSIKLPKSFYKYSVKEQQRIRLAFPAVAFGSKKKTTKPDSFNDTMFAPVTR